MAGSEQTGSGRIESLDRLRGIVIALMVLDHVREFIHVSGYAFNPLDPKQTTVLLYVTRWVTHFCAPTFVFLSGVSTWLQRARGKETKALAWLLLTRGLWLIFLENTVIAFGWAFTIPLLFFVQVIWAIGWGMVALSALVWLPRAAVLGLGLAIVLGHDLLDAVQPDRLGELATLWKFLHVTTVIQVGSLPVLIAYPVVPWAGLMFLGYGLGPVFGLDPVRRDRMLVQLGVALIAAFLILRGFNLYGDPGAWQPRGTLRDTLMVFFNVNKYPPSLLYVCITLGPVLLLLPVIERWRGAPARFFQTLGAVPFFAYILHLYIAHSLAIVITLLWGKSTAALFDQIYKSIMHPEELTGTGLPLYVVYLLWIAVLAILYPLCRWFADFRRRRRGQWWLSYL